MCGLKKVASRFFFSIFEIDIIFNFRRGALVKALKDPAASIHVQSAAHNKEVFEVERIPIVRRVYRGKP